MKATIKRVITLSGDHFYRVYANDQIVCSHFFNPISPIGYPSNEQNAYELALQTAKRIENNPKEIEEVVYETKSDETA